MSAEVNAAQQQRQYRDDILAGFWETAEKNVAQAKKVQLVHCMNWLFNWFFVFRVNRLPPFHKLFPSLDYLLYYSYLYLPFSFRFMYF